MSNRPVIVSACRTAITDAYRGSLGPVDVRDLAAAVVTEAIDRSGLPPESVDDVVLGEVLQGGGCIARYAAIAAGLPDDTPGLALNRQCATGLTAVATASANIAAGMDKVVVAGGAENMTQSPISYRKAAHPYGIPEQFISPSHPDRRRRSQHEHDDHGRREHGAGGRHLPGAVRRVGLRLAPQGCGRHRRGTIQGRDRPGRGDRTGTASPGPSTWTSIPGATRPSRSWRRSGCCRGSRAGR